MSVCRSIILVLGRMADCWMGLSLLKLSLPSLLILRGILIRSHRYAPHVKIRTIPGRTAEKTRTTANFHGVQSTSLSVLSRGLHQSGLRLHRRTHQVGSEKRPTAEIVSRWGELLMTVQMPMRRLT